MVQIKLNPSKKKKKLGMTSVAMTDHGNMFGAIDFYNAMRAEGIKPIIGMEAYIHNSEDLGDKTTRQRYHLCLYAKMILDIKLNVFKFTSLYAWILLLS